jgi:hypothetical protein
VVNVPRDGGETFRRWGRGALLHPERLHRSIRKGSPMGVTQTKPRLCYGQGTLMKSNSGGGRS